MSARLGPAFRNIWIAWTVSAAGDAVGLLALPLAAAVTLGASPFEMGLLQAAGSLPFLLFGLLAGVWVDRCRRKRIVVASDVARGLILLTIPLAALLDILTMPQLLAVAFVAGAFNVFFSVATLSLVPAVAGRRNLVEANSRMEASQAVVRTAAPAPAGALIQLAGAPLAIALDAVSFIVSGLIVARTSVEEVALRTEPSEEDLRGEIVEGLRAIFGQPLVRPVVLASASFVLFAGFQFAVYILFLVDHLDLSATMIGLLFGVGSVASIASATLGSRLTEGLTFGRSLTLAISFRVGSLFIPPLVSGPVTLPLLMISHLLLGFGTPLWNINQVSLRQAVTPDELLGRMNATVRFAVWSMMPVGAIGGGVLGELLGLRMTMMFGAIGSTLAIAWVVFSRVPTLRAVPTSLPAPSIEGEA